MTYNEEVSMWNVMALALICWSKPNDTQFFVWFKGLQDGLLCILDEELSSMCPCVLHCEVRNTEQLHVLKSVGLLAYEIQYHSKVSWQSRLKTWFSILGVFKNWVSSFNFKDWESSFNDQVSRHSKNFPKIWNRDFEETT